MTRAPAPFEADLDPETKQPRMRFNFFNGWCVSILLGDATGRCDFYSASVAVCPSGYWRAGGVVELLGTELSVDAAMDLVDAVRARPTIAHVKPSRRRRTARA